MLGEGAHGAPREAFSVTVPRGSFPPIPDIRLMSAFD